ncbi:MAG TPA: prolyl oligopeptidase family serine peptidase [Pyrinomonadaceae bacterium]|nr:prolyl oligopeptidase family serine peptidase [Pyrinomonadaceae bacterium]
MKRVLFLLLAVIFMACACGPKVPDEFPPREVNGRGYRVYVPPNPDPNAKLPVMLYLHGSGARGDDNIAQADAFGRAIEPVKDKINFIVVLPQCDDDNFWSAQDMSEYALAALDQTVKEFNGDTDRLYLAGFSLGGYGTWQIAAAYPGKFAALMPVAGGVVGTYPFNPDDRQAIIPSVGDMLGSSEPYKEIAKAIGQTPVWVFHGAKDDSVSVEFARRMVAALEAEGRTDAKYTEYPDGGHQIFGKAIAQPGFLEWLADQRKVGRGFQPVR